MVLRLNLILLNPSWGFNRFLHQTDLQDYGSMFKVWGLDQELNSGNQAVMRFDSKCIKWNQIEGLVGTEMFKIVLEKKLPI